MARIDNIYIYIYISGSINDLIKSGKADKELED